jgi:hypothetical protein
LAFRIIEEIQKISMKILNYKRSINEKLKENFATCLIKIMINKDSSISKVEAITMKGTKLSQIATDAIINDKNGFLHTRKRKKCKLLQYSSYINS